MKPISEAWAGLIDVTYYCGRRCVYCTRYDRHLGDKRYHMPLSKIEEALISYEGFAGRIGIIGGDPLLHPEFQAICALARRYYPPEKLQLFTSINPHSSKYAENISATFKYIAYNPHTDEQEAEWCHQPLTLAVKDMVKDKQLKKELIDDCWVQRKWCPTITIDGAFFCEVGASIARISGFKGWPVVKGWWQKEPSDFGAQLNLCEFCGMCIPMVRQKMADKKQKISPSVVKLLKENGSPLGDYILVDQPFTIEEMKAALSNWTPSIYKQEQIGEVFTHSTIDWTKYKD
jgi:hypothetical protein